MTKQTMTSKAHDAIAGVVDHFVEAFRLRDAQELATLYTEDGELFPPNSGIVRGRSAIAGFWAQVMELGIKSVRLQTIEVDEQGETAIEVGSGTLYGAGEQVIDEVKYIVVWKLVNGEWKLHRDIWNSVRPLS